LNYGLPISTELRADYPLSPPEIERGSVKKITH
jgi:hypothetical protein